MTSVLRQSGSSCLHPGALALVGLAVILGAGAFDIHERSAPSLMSRADHRGARIAIEGTKGAALVACAAMSGHAEHVCNARAWAEERLHLAQLESRYRGTVISASDALIARTRADGDIAAARCGIFAGGDRTACLHAAVSRTAASH